MPGIGEFTSDNIGTYTPHAWREVTAWSGAFESVSCISPRSGLLQVNVLGQGL